MRTHGLRAAFTCVVALGLLTGRPAGAQTPETQGESLAGLEGVQVLVEDLDASLAPYELTQATLTAQIEQQLQSGGVRSLTEADRLNSPGAPFLYVVVATNQSGNAYAYAVKVSVGQALWSFVTGEVVWGDTWQASGVGLTLTENLGRSVRGALSTYVARFMAAWHAANDAAAAIDAPVPEAGGETPPAAATPPTAPQP